MLNRWKVLVDEGGDALGGQTLAGVGCALDGLVGK